MQGTLFMQLLIILAMLMFGGKSDTQKLLSEVKPMLETFGGNEIKEALKSAEEISQVLTAVRDFTGAPSEEVKEEEFFSGGVRQEPDVAFPLAPISSVADKEITYSLSKYISSVN